MTAPLTPADCDLQDFPYMPLHVARLRDSDLAAESSPEACWYAVLLWAASWHQIPAASLPDNDATLARLIGLGRDVRTFRKHKDQAMHGFVLCDDGRFYHPVVAEQARVAWEGKLQQRWRTECARIKKHNQRHGTHLPLPTYEDWLAAGGIEHCPPLVPETVPGDEGACPPGQSLQEKGKGKERLLQPPTPPEGDAPSRFDQGWNAYPIGGRGNRGPAKARAEWAAAAERAGGEERLIGAINAHAERLEADARQTPKAFDRWLRDDGFAAYLRPEAAGPARRWIGPETVWRAVAEARSAAFANTWLADCAWQEAPVRAVVTTSPTTFSRLRQEVGPVLSDLGIQLLEKAA